MRLITAIGCCCLLLATFITANPDVSHLKYTRRPYKKHLTTTTTIPNTKSDTLRKESAYVFKPRLIQRKGIRINKFTTETLPTSTTLPTTSPATTIVVAESLATQPTTTSTAAPTTATTTTTTTSTSTTKPTVELTEIDDSLSVINNSDSVSSSGSNVKRNERDGKHLQDAWDIRHNIPGEPGVDYPIYFEAPDSKFDCENRHDGYYADVEARCQAFHVCANTALEERGFIFLCPNGTVFSQENFVCDWYTNVDCPESEKFYYKNEELGRFIGSKEEMLIEVQKMFNYTLRNLLNYRATGGGSSDNGNGGSINGADGNSITSDNFNQNFGNFSAIPIINHKMRKTGNKTKGIGKTAIKDDVYISNLGELSTDPDADFDINVVKEQARLKSELAKKNKEGSFAELWGQDIDQLDTILSQNRLKKSPDGSRLTVVTPNPAASTITKRDVSHLPTTPGYIAPNRYLPSLRKTNLRTQSGYHYEPPRPIPQIDMITTTESYGQGSIRRTRPPTTNQVYTRRPLPTKTTIVTPVTYPTTTKASNAKRPTFRFDVVDKSESLLEYRGNFNTTEKPRGDQNPVEDFYDDVVDFESRKEKPIDYSTIGEITNEQSLKTTADIDNLVNTVFVQSTTNENEQEPVVNDQNKSTYPAISSPIRYTLVNSVVSNEVTMMKRPIIRLMPPYKINRTMDEKQEIVQVNRHTIKPVKTNLVQNIDNLTVVFASNENITNHDVTVRPTPIDVGLKSNLETSTQSSQILDDVDQSISTEKSGSILILPPFDDEHSTISSIINLEQTDERDVSPVKVYSQILDFEDQDLNDLLIDPEDLKIRLRPEIEPNGEDHIESTTVRIDTGHKVELSQLEDVHTNNRDDRLALIQKMIKILEQRMKLKLGDLPPADEYPSVVTTTTSSSFPDTHFSLDDMIREMEMTQNKGVGANLIFAMMKILENGQNRTKSTENPRPGDGSPLQPIFSSLQNAQTESPIKLRDEDILNNQDINLHIHLLQNTDDDELKSILEINQVEQMRKYGNLLFNQTTPKSVTNEAPGQHQTAYKIVYQKTDKTPQMDDRRPQITIKEVFGNRNNILKPTTTDHSNEITGNRVPFYGSNSINRLSEPPPAITKPNLQFTPDSQNVQRPAPINVSKYTFGTKINQGANEQPSHIPISEAAPIDNEMNINTFETGIAEIPPASSVSQISFDSSQDNKFGDPFVSISKTRIAEVAPTNQPAAVTPHPSIETSLDTKQYNEASDPSLDISKTRIAEVAPPSQPSTVTSIPAIQMSFDQQQYNQESDPSLTISKTRIAEVPPTSQPMFVAQMPDANVLFGSQQYNGVSDPSVDISKTRLAEISGNQPALVKHEPDIKSFFDSNSINGLTESSPTTLKSDLNFTPNSFIRQMAQPTPINVSKFMFGTQVISGANEQSDVDQYSSIDISKTRIVEVPPASQPSTITASPTIDMSFDQQQQYNLGSDPLVDISKTRIAEVPSASQPMSVIPMPGAKVSFGTQQYNEVGDPSLDILKTRIAEVPPASQPFTITAIPTIDMSFDQQQQYNLGSDPLVDISKTRIAEVPPASQPISVIPMPGAKVSFGTQQYNEVGDRSLDISKTRIAEVPPASQPSTITAIPTIDMSFDEQQQYNLGSDPLVDISKTRIAEVPPASQPMSVIAMPGAKVSFGTQQYNGVGDSSLDISKTRIAEVPPASQPSTITAIPTIDISFDQQQQYNRGSDPLLDISKTRIAEVPPASQPMSVIPMLGAKVSFGTQQYNGVGDPSLDISKTRIAEVPPASQPLSIMQPSPGVTSYFESPQYNQMYNPSPTFSKGVSEPSADTKPLVKFSFGTQINNGANDQTYMMQIPKGTLSNELYPQPISEMMFGSLQNTQVDDPTPSISKTRITEVPPPNQPSSVIPETGVKPSFDSPQYNQVFGLSQDTSDNRLAEATPVNQPTSLIIPNVLNTVIDAQQNNRVNKPSLIVSKTRIAEVEPLKEPPTVTPPPVVETALNLQQYNQVDKPSLDISKTRLAEVPTDEFSFGAEINNLANEFPAISESDINLLSDQHEARIPGMSPINIQSALAAKSVTILPHDAQVTHISDSPRSMPNILPNQYVPETYHNVAENNDQNTPDLEDSKIEESDANARVEGKFSGFINNNPDQNNLGVKGKGYVYENKLSPEVLKIYNINPIKTYTESTLSVSMPTATVTTATVTSTTPKPIIITSPTTERPRTATTIPTTQPITLTRPAPTVTTKTVKTESEAPHFIQVEDSIGQKHSGGITDTKYVFKFSKPNILTETSTTTKVTPTVFVQPQTVSSSQSVRPQIAVKTNTQDSVSTLQPRPQTIVSSTDIPISTIHQNILKQLPGLVITHSIDQSTGHIVTHGGTTPQRISLSHSTVNTERPRITKPSFGTQHSVFQYPIPVQQSSTTRIQQQRPVTTERPVPPQQQFVQSQQGVGGLQNAQARRPVQEQNQILFPTQRPQIQPLRNQFSQTQQSIQSLQGGQLISQSYGTPPLGNRPVPKPILPNQFPFGTEQQTGFANEQNGQLSKDNVIVNIVPSINWYLNDARDRNSYFAAIQRGLIPNDIYQFNQGHLRYGVPLEFQNQNQFGQQQQRPQSNNFHNGNQQIARSRYSVLGAREDARQAEFPLPNINDIPLDTHAGSKFLGRDTDYVENSNRRIDDSNTIRSVDNEKDSLYKGVTSYNAPLGSVGKLPCDSDSINGGGRRNDCLN